MRVAPSGQLVLVEWLDAAAQAGWTAVADVKNKPETVMTVGFLVLHDDKAITVCGDRGKHHKRRLKKGGEINRTLTIPAGMVVAVTEIHL